MKHYDIESAAARIRAARKQRGFTQEQAAEAVFVDRNTISRIERGVMACSVEMFISLADLYGTSVDYLITGKTHSRKDLGEKLDTVIALLTGLRQLI